MKPFKDTYVMYQLLEFVDESGIIVLCKASKKLNEICKQYIEMEDDKRFKIIMTEIDRNCNFLLGDYCKNNDMIKIKKLINIDLHWELPWNWGLSNACQGGNLDIVKLMIEKGANWWDSGFSNACRYGHMECVKLMIKKGADYWNIGLHYACKYGHIDIVKLMIEKGATQCGDCCRKSMEEHLSKKKFSVGCKRKK